MSRNKQKPSMGTAALEGCSALHLWNTVGKHCQAWVSWRVGHVARDMTLVTQFLLYMRERALLGKEGLVARPHV